MPMTTENTQSTQPPRASRSGPGRRCAVATTPQARAMHRYKLGTNRITQHRPTLTNINRYLSRPPAVPTGEALVRVLSAALHQQARPVPALASSCPSALSGLPIDDRALLHG
jgi:hypothetical protein